MICFSLGSNLGDSLGYLRKAVDALQLVFGKPVKMSSVYETESWGVVNHPPYLNATICFNTELSPDEVLKNIMNIEKQLGRVRSTAATPEPRTIDIDILFYDEWILNNSQLIIPHPRIKDRKFVLIPLVEMMGNYRHPQTGECMLELLEKCKDTSQVVKTELLLNPE